MNAPLHPLSQLRPGLTICQDKYTVQGRLGAGGFARVWLAIDVPMAGRQVAIKEPLFSASSPQSAEIERRFAQEVCIAATLDAVHAPHIVRALGAEPYGDTLLLIMQYMPGGDLAARLRKRPQGWPWPQAVALTRQLLQALAAVHDLPEEIIHRDIKPSNLLFDQRDRIYLADFGLAQMADQSLGRSRDQGPPHPGTPAYMAPEQQTSPLPLTPAADLYAVGCVLFEMIATHTWHSLRQRHPAGQEATRAMATLLKRQSCPSWLIHALTQTLAEDPAARYQTAEALASALAEPVSEKKSATWPGPGPSQLSPLAGASDPLSVTSPAQTATPRQADPAHARRQKPVIRRLQREPDPALLSPLDLVSGAVILVLILSVLFLGLGAILGP